MNAPRWRAAVDARFPDAVYGRGQEPDPRFSLANERTFLAWIRTALALLAVAIALLALDLPLTDGWQVSGALLFAVSSMAVSAWSWISWCRTERALRMRQPLPGLGWGGSIAALVLVGSALLALGVIASKFG